MDWRGLLLHLVHLVCESSCDDRSVDEQYLRWYRAPFHPALHRRSDGGNGAGNWSIAFLRCSLKFHYDAALHDYRIRRTDIACTWIGILGSGVESNRPHSFTAIHHHRNGFTGSRSIAARTGATDGSGLLGKPFSRRNGGGWL